MVDHNGIIQLCIRYVVKPASLGVFIHLCISFTYSLLYVTGNKRVGCLKVVRQIWKRRRAGISGLQYFVRSGCEVVFGVLPRARISPALHKIRSGS